ncbi:MAG: hypothetical protein KAG66_00775 [Methylococcales bacterium]|nr:hypothetical protein [Methylococcales bacterium]
MDCRRGGASQNAPLVLQVLPAWLGLRELSAWRCLLECRASPLGIAGVAVPVGESGRACSVTAQAAVEMAGSHVQKRAIETTAARALLPVVVSSESDTYTEQYIVRDVR